MKIAITGSTGMVGRALVAGFKEKGHAVTRIVRPGTHGRFSDEVIRWDPKIGSIEAAKIDGYDVIIHLAGANLSAHRWTSSYKKVLRDSRIRSTRFLSETIAGLKTPPMLFICASAVGFYGSRPPDLKLDETASPGGGFLSDLCVEWERATQPVQDAGIRVVNLRLGVVLSRKGGALSKMLPVFQLGLGGPVGNGAQMMSWIALDEIFPLVEYVIEEHDLRGPVNAVAPGAVSNREFASAFGKALGRPAVLPLPAFMVKLMFGEMGTELLLGGANVKPRNLVDAGYAFRYPDLRSALEGLGFRNQD